jgi:hypothetical protein
MELTHGIMTKQTFQKIPVFARPERFRSSKSNPAGFWFSCSSLRPFLKKHDWLLPE